VAQQPVKQRHGFRIGVVQKLSQPQGRDQEPTTTAFASR
jgi:hypothetical protein